VPSPIDRVYRPGLDPPERTPPSPGTGNRELPAGGLDVAAVGAPVGRADAEIPQHVGERGDALLRRCGVRRRGRVVRDQVHVERRPAAEQPPQPARIAVGVVHAVEQEVLDEDAPPGPLAVVPAGGHEALDRIPARDGHQLLALLVGRRVQREGEPERERLLREPLDPRHPAGRRDRDVASTKVEAVGIVHRPAGLEHVVVVQEGLAHPHHHHVPDRRIPLAQDPRQGQELLHDLPGAQAAAEAHLARRAESAGERTAGLGREAHGAAAAVAHGDRLDREPVPREEAELDRAVRGSAAGRPVMSS
jgi:hypothetical protein